MAERGGNWWDSWYKAAKDKSVEVLEFVKRDLDEFSTAVKSEASNVVSSTTTVLKDKLKLDEPESTASNVKRSMSSFLGQMSNVLNPSPQDEDEEAIVIFDSQPVPLTKFQTQLHSLIMDPNTFLIDPDEAKMPQYQAWLEIVEDQLTPERLTKLMAASPDLHNQYTKLVPNEVSHLLFWQRYLFHKALLEDDEARREAMERRAEREKQAAENFVWDQEEDFGANIELSEEEQTRLLLEYEKECEDKKLNQSEDTLLDKNLKDNHYSLSSSSNSYNKLSTTHSDPKLCTTTEQSEKYEHTSKHVNAEDAAEERDELDSLRTRERKDMVIVTADGSSCHTSSCSGDKESNDGDWEREFDLEETETEIIEQQTIESVQA